jgi:hypothetical protein
MWKSNCQHAVAVVRSRQTRGLKAHHTAADINNRRCIWGKPGPCSCASLSSNHTRRMRDVFACSKCHSIYEITRHRQQPLGRPRCQVCQAQFPPSELGDWLSYQRAEPEWTVGEWLTGHTVQLSVSSRHQRPAALAQRRVPTSEWPLPASQAQKLSPVSARGSHGR